MLLSILCILCLAPIVVLLLELRSDGSRAAPASAPPAAGVESAISHDAADLTDPDRIDSHRTPSAAAPDAHASIADTPRAPSENERGVIRGRVSVAPGLAFPDHWTLRIGADPYAHGRERVQAQTIEFTHGEDTFRIEDLTLGGYAVQAEAPGLFSMPLTVLLVDGSSNQWASIVLTRTGFVVGSLVDVDGRPAEGVHVTLESSTTRARKTDVTDPSGSYRFDDVADGEYKLYVGRPESPLLPPDSLVFQAPAMHFPSRTLPASGIARIFTRDEVGRPIADVAITGFASPAGTVDARSDAGGSAVVRHLPTGRYRLHARHEDGRSGTALVEVVAGETVVVDIRLAPD